MAGDGTDSRTGPVRPPGSLVVPEERSDPDATLREAIVAIRQTHPAYGYRRVTEALRRSGLRINKKRVQRVRRALLAPPLPRRARWKETGPDDTGTGWYLSEITHFYALAITQIYAPDLVRCGA